MVCIVIKDWFQGKFTHAEWDQKYWPKKWTWAQSIHHSNTVLRCCLWAQGEEHPCPFHPCSCSLRAPARILPHGELHRVLQHSGRTPRIRFLPLARMTLPTFDLFWSAKVSKIPWGLGSVARICFMWNIYVMYLYTVLGKKSVNSLFWDTRDQMLLRRHDFLQRLYIKKSHYFFCQNCYIKEGKRGTMILKQRSGNSMVKKSMILSSGYSTSIYKPIIITKRYQ